MKRHADPRQLDLFAWADARPRAVVLDAIPRIARRMWKEIHEPRVERAGRLIELTPSPPVLRRSA